MPFFEIRTSTLNPGSPVPAGVNLLIQATTASSGGENSTINYTGAALTPPTGTTVFHIAQTITATNGAEPTLAAGPLAFGAISAVIDAATWGPSGKHGLPIKSVAAGVWQINSNLTIPTLATGLVARVGFRVWQVSADLTSFALIDLSGGGNVNGWIYSGSFTSNLNSQGFIVSSPSLGAVTFAAATPYLYIEQNIYISTGGTNLTAQGLVLASTNIHNMPSLSLASSPVETSTGPIRISDASANKNDGTPVGITPLATVASPFGAGFGNAITFEGINRLNDDTQGISFGTGVGLPSGSWTLDVLFKAAPVSAIAPIIAKRNNANTSGHQFNLFLNNSNQLQCNIIRNDGTLISLVGTTAIATGALCKVALDYNSSTSTVRLYSTINDSAAATPLNTSYTGVQTDNNTIRFLVGRNDESEGAFSCGHTIDEIRISNISRYGATYTPPTAPFTSDANTLLLAHMDTLTANPSPSDTPTRVFTGARSTSETVSSASSSVSRIYNALRTTTETFTSTDLASPTGSFSRTITESLTVTDTPTRLQVLARSLAETQTRTDSISRLFTGSRPITESSTTTDSITRSFVGARSLSETNATTDAPTRVQSLARLITETLSHSDLSSRVYAAFRLLTEALSAADAISRTAAFKRSPTAESSTTTDTVTRSQGVGRSPVESFTLTDLVARTLNASRPIIETGTPSDVVTRTAQCNRLLNESNTTTPSVSRVVGFGRTATETVTSIDTVARTFTASRIVTETLNGNTPDWPLNPPTKTIAGVVRDEDTNAAVGTGYTVQLIRTADNVMVASTSTDANGNYSFARGSDDPYTYVVYAFNTASTQMHGTTDRGLVPA